MSNRATRLLAVARVAPVAHAGGYDRQDEATKATTENVVASANPLTNEVRSQRGHRCHPGTEDYGSPISSIWGRVARSILLKEIDRVAPVASALVAQWVSRGHPNSVGGFGGPALRGARAPP
jgi:hypothetical protein